MLDMNEAAYDCIRMKLLICYDEAAKLFSVITIIKSSPQSGHANSVIHYSLVVNPERMCCSFDLIFFRTRHFTELIEENMPWYIVRR